MDDLPEELRAQLALLASAEAELERIRTSILAADAARAAIVQPYVGSGIPIRILQLGSNVPGGHTNTDQIFTPDRYEVTTMRVELASDERPLPAHDLVFNAIADPDSCDAALVRAQSLVTRTNKPVLNAPAAARLTGRLGNGTRLRDLPGVRAPRIARLARALLQGASAEATLRAHGLAFPLLLRAPGFHNGEHFTRVAAPADLAPALARIPGEELYAIEFIDLRDDAGRFWKYRAMIVDGALYPAHLAVARDWNVHYFSAEMGEEEQAAQRRFCDDIAGYLGPAAMQALSEVARALNLDYAGIDFSLAPSGEVVVFEANAAMTIYVPDSGDSLASRRSAALRIHDAVRAMIARRSGRAA